MKLTIDQIPCDLDPSQRIALDYDAQDLADVRSGNKGHALRLRLPATRTNDRIFGFAAEPYTGQRFNAAQHTAVLSDGEAKLLQGSVRLLSAAYDSDPEGYLIEIRSGTSEWARQAAAEMFNTLGISFSGRLTPTMIRQTWTNNTPVKFFPVCRDEYTPELSSVELIPVERFLSVDDYHPFISAATVVQTLFSEAGYTLESDFLNGEFFRSLYLSGAYSSRDTNALRNHMDFLARRTTTAATTAREASWPVRWAVLPRPNQPREWLPGIDSGKYVPSISKDSPRAGSRRRPITSQTRILMNHAVYSDTPTLAAVSRSGSASAMQAANSIHAAAGSFERASSPSVPAPKVRPHPRHSHLWRPAASRPFLTKAGQPHLGQRSGSPPPEASSSAMACRRASASLLFSASGILRT